MTSQKPYWPIGVFTSVDAGLGVHLEVAQDLKVPTVQVHAPHPQTRTREHAQAFRAKCDAAGLQVTVIFGGFDGESYADIPTTARTVGLVPLETRASRVAEMKEISDFASWVGCPAIGLHIGFVPESSSPDYSELVRVTQDLLTHAANHGQAVHLETGQESADHLLEFIEDVNRPNLGINFDPANMILYGTGNPIEALRKVARYVRSIHCKDALWAPVNERGKSWGQEVALGTGDVGMEAYLTTLWEIGYRGPLTIEREIPHDPVQQKKDLASALELLTGLQKKIANC